MTNRTTIALDKEVYKRAKHICLDLEITPGELFSKLLNTNYQQLQKEVGEKNKKDVDKEEVIQESVSQVSGNISN